MKQLQNAMAGSAILIVMGVLLSWTNLRFPEITPSGIKLTLLILTGLLYFTQIFLESRAAYNCTLYTCGFAAAFYWIAAIESCRSYRIHHASCIAWALLGLSILIALGITQLALTPDDDNKK